MRKNRIFNIIIFLCAASACKAGSFYYTGTLPTGKGEFPTEISLSIQKDYLIDHIEYFYLSGQRMYRISGQGLVIKKIYYHNNSVKTTKTIIR